MIVIDVDGCFRRERLLSVMVVDLQCERQPPTYVCAVFFFSQRELATLLYRWQMHGRVFHVCVVVGVYIYW